MERCSRVEGSGGGTHRLRVTDRLTHFSTRTWQAKEHMSAPPSLLQRLVPRYRRRGGGGAGCAIAIVVVVLFVILLKAC